MTAAAGAGAEVGQNPAEMGNQIATHRSRKPAAMISTNFSKKREK